MPKKSSIEDFIKKTSLVHGDKYNYSKSVYVNSATKLIIICPIHGEFEQEANSHLNGSGCSECAQVKKLTTESFIKKALIIHGNRYNYSETSYVKSNLSVTIECLVHGIFLQKPNSHLNGNGCGKCGENSKKISQQVFIDNCIKVHGTKYSYHKSTYVNYRTPVIIVCPIHNEFIQTPNRHISGLRGCPDCSDGGGFRSNKSGTCYYIKIETVDQILYKIGITNQSVKHRFGNPKDIKITSLQELYFDDGFDCLALERKILKEYREFQYKGLPILQNGNTEIFIKDVLNLDKTLLI